MLRPEFYPHRPSAPELKQTHISYIFIAGDYVYKIKKPVDFGFLDFTSLDKRRRYCLKELELNKRLAPDVYLKVLPISRDNDGNYLLESKKNIVEYALKMRKLPEERMLKRLFAEGKADISLMDAIARKVVSFHKQAATGGEIDKMGSLKTIFHNHEENFAQTASYIDATIPRHKYDFIKSYVHNFLDNNSELFQDRIAGQKIRDCHGDLHLEHICITDEVVIFDCIEFNERFRYEDVAAETAFLAMDLDYNNYSEYADAFVTAYVRHSGDAGVFSLLNFYRCYYAYVRGKVISFRINDQSISDEEQMLAATAAARYFDLAYAYACRLEKPALIITAGLMGTGKSALAKVLASHLGADIVRSDVLRKGLLHIAPTSRHYDDFGKGIYSDDISRQTYDRALEIASEKINNGKSVIIDASYKKMKDRLDAYDAAKKLSAGFYLLECTCPEEIIKARLEKRKLNHAEVSDGRWEIYLAQKADFEQISEIPEEHHMVIDTSLDREAYLDKLIRRLKRMR